MGFVEAVKTCLMQKYVDFKGRASRSEFWWFFLFQIIVCIVAAVIHPLLQVVVGLGLLLPSISAGVRRLHDTGRSGWWILLGLIPLVGLVLIVFLALPGTEGSNDYGDVPTPASA